MTVEETSFASVLETTMHGRVFGTSAPRAERRARFLAPWKSADDKIEELLKAVREPDTA